MHYEAELVILFLFLGLVCEGYAICRVVKGNGTSGREVMEWHILSRIPRLGIADECGVMM